MYESEVFRRQDRWLSAWVGSELVLMNGNTGSYVSVSETAGRIWEQLETPRSLNFLCEALAAEYDADPVTIRSEVGSFLQRMQEEGAVESHAERLA